MAEHAFEYKVTFSTEDGAGIVTFEATREDLVSYCLQVKDAGVATLTEGTFQKTSPLAKNVKLILCDKSSSPILKLDDTVIQSKSLSLKFSAEFLETHFTLTLNEVENSPMELLAKRVERLEANQRLLLSSSLRLVFEAESNQRNNSLTQVFRNENVISFGERSLTFLKAGLYQLIVSGFRDPFHVQLRVPGAPRSKQIYIPTVAVISVGEQEELRFIDFCFSRLTIVSVRI
mmetsp:Transcript_13496/g.20876  ORF Transcript_13496/g.20876 Transcript_13496/m.20876 type:complete len:232 (-) Transcript_13496:201-896(-)|eukprot:CAMPEP_0201516280 /NCGR_PEP_ID=MMETSP0161_2-20130828/7649_1 /ASSEMBLY_ACC=CAM_ASM_000251 /TAXON_ID=180227 /ORGANISM="Neoparamoeba aestuarina, Strain SoJaBio B1-5/56/2" /LENGTH=231 /DNA_ID=CAMNT_0047913351 /DNA_START=55 /DNA_END=750 /DNA_ORIENTATION=+